MPNEFWPDTPAPPYLSNGIGNEIQQKTAANNPDIFCKSQGSSYRLPSIGEFNSVNKRLKPGDNREPQSPAHWSQYVNNDTTKEQFIADNARNVNGSLANEWGDVTKYSNGWEVGSYWSTEVSVMTNSYYGQAIGGYGRPVFNGLTTSYPPYYKDYGTLFNEPLSNVATLLNVVCVRDLVPTPSTPTPSKS